ncbi:hypothetical protein BKA63DRAFT_485681 [Paraphoma chrysanthemicola]|nr:hypothetical protein BKA63DRAFT_485681 [Paraphoma chrysanthemicola]
MCEIFALSDSLALSSVPVLAVTFLFAAQVVCRDATDQRRAQRSKAGSTIKAGSRDRTVYDPATHSLVFERSVWLACEQTNVSSSSSQSALNGQTTTFDFRLYDSDSLVQVNGVEGADMH